MFCTNLSGTFNSPCAKIAATDMSKLDTARNMLLYSEYSISEISSVFAFSSQSHFTEAFHKFYGETPLQCRQRNITELP